MKKLWKGNYALVEGAIHGGLDSYFGYPITPQNEVTEYMSKRMREEGRVFLQAESELGAINMVFGAALTGKKTMTTSSSPGISLMQEGISYLVGCDLPCVIVNVQRGGPGLGNISGAQGDYFQATRGGGHGDYRMIVLTPSSVQELYEMTRDSFNLAFKYRNPVMVLTDGVLGQMSEPAEIPEQAPEYKSKEEDLGWNLTGSKNRGPRFIRSLMMGKGKNLEQHNYDHYKKVEKMKQEVNFEEQDTEDAEIVLVGYGTSARIIYDSYKKLRNRGIKAGYFRLKTAFPFPEQRIKQISDKSKILVVEMSMGQMVEDVKLSCQKSEGISFYGRPAGGVPEVSEINKRAEDILK